jgi:hypothetical protein
MSCMKALLSALVFVILFCWQSQAQPLKLAQGKFSTEDGTPLANQTLLLEGQNEARWFDFFRPETTKVTVFAVTDEKGFLQFVDLPPGKYTLKLVRAGKETVPLKSFALESGYQKTDISTKLKLKDSNSPMKVIGITADGQPVFSNGLDARARKVTHQATATSAGLMEDGTSWHLSSEEK